VYAVAATSDECAVAEVDDDLISNLRANDRSQNSKPLWLRLFRTEGAIGGGIPMCGLTGPLITTDAGFANTGNNS